MAKILLVDDDAQGLESARKILEFSAHEVTTAQDGSQALERVRGASFDLVVTDVRMPKLGGLEFLRALSLCGETTPVILMTAFGRVEDAVWAMKLGAVDFLTKPFKRQQLLSSVEAALKRSRSRAKPGAEKPLPEERTLVGRSQAIRALKQMIAQVAPTAATVLLQGESGTGKELVARCLHLQSARASQPFIALNCAAVPEQLIESELFGFEKGAFTGAATAKQGLFEAADGGTLLLDEIGDMPLSLQAKLLRVLQESEVRRVGATASRKIDVRVIAATHRDLKDCVRTGTFREDLLYRLAVIELPVPPLRERQEDIPELAYHFLADASKRHGKSIEGIAEETMEALLGHPWPGNVRELSNVIERGVVFSSGPYLTPAELPAHLLAGPRARPQSGTMIEVPFGTSLKDVEELLIRKTLEATSGDKNMTAKLLGINSRTIYRKLDTKKTDQPAE
ncbi:MAG: sigma-54-dependent transcriptional regulator [Bdellovibrionota bacterium]